MVLRGEHDRRCDQASLGPRGLCGVSLNNLTLQQCSARLLCFVRPKPPYMPVSVTTLKKRRSVYAGWTPGLCRVENGVPVSYLRAARRTRLRQEGGCHGTKI